MNLGNGTRRLVLLLGNRTEQCAVGVPLSENLRQADISGQIQGQSDTSGLLLYSGRPHSQDGFPEFVYVSAFVFSPVIFRTKAS